ncbi:MAG: hypothetical protein EXS38_07320 [Opitutus sp.]|nr:hypothetical protein [Opitutus sp.]
MDQLLQKIPLFVIVFIVISIVRAMNQAKEARKKHEKGGAETDEQRRLREVQERIRRAIAERRGEPVEAEAPPLLETSQPRTSWTGDPQPTDPFGGPMRRVLDTLERRAQPPVIAAPVAVVRNAELVRQQHLAGQLRALAETRALDERRAAGRASDLVESANSETGRREAAHTRLQEDLLDPQSLRRAIVLREILGTPVGLR